MREFNDDDKLMKHRVQPGPMVKDPADAKKVMAKLLGRGNEGAKTKSV